jgi:hypothetical protein
VARYSNHDILDTSHIIRVARSSTIAEFLQRVQAVIWNRYLIRTDGGRLGLVQESAETGDRICILYGCSIPVVLRKFEKTPAQLREEQAEDEIAHEEQKKEAVLKIKEFWRKVLHERAERREAWKKNAWGGNALGKTSLGKYT